MNKLESLQYQAGLAVTGMLQGTNRDSVYEEPGWESLHMRRWFRRLTVFYKIVKHLTALLSGCFIAKYWIIR